MVGTTGPPATDPAPILVRDVELVFGARTWVMGIINVTPDSFSGDGLLRDGEDGADGAGAGDADLAAVDRARQMVAQGADLLDIGALMRIVS